MQFSCKSYAALEAFFFWVADNYLVVVGVGACPETRGCSWENDHAIDAFRRQTSSDSDRTDCMSRAPGKCSISGF